ncbi:hypothetical protein [Tautonia sociabilis]|uniref:DUF1579 domain-containing protein n=1 Tax=Tautonia sociabilis TaxID=2080755 RepID=A0A432MN03_9BACT|nr:hypothetical protein [Tautonia sociabilis]RUL88680.1 hypothetical protein TsocGM_05955 [Tautonia sociabilis]
MSHRLLLILAPAALWIALAPARAEGPAAGATPAEGLDGPAAFERMKTLVGTWEQREGEEAFVITYQLIASGSALVETYGPGTPHEMISVYHLDGDDLRATHYCAIGNQPRLLLDREASSPDTLVFSFDGGSNLDPATDMHMHEGRFLLHDADHITSSWTAYRDGQPAGTHDFTLTRRKD